MALNPTRRLPQQALGQRRRGDIRLTECPGVQVVSDARDMVDYDPLRYARVIAGQATQAQAQRVCEGLGKRCEQDLGVRMPASQASARCNATIVFPVLPLIRTGPL